MLRSHRRPSVLAVLLALVLVASACGGGGDDDASADEAAPSTSETTAPADDDDADDTELITTDAELDLPRSVQYAGVDLRVGDAVWSNATPASYGRSEPMVGEDVLLYLEVTSGFVEGFPGDDGFMPLRHFVIETADGERHPATGVEYVAELPVLASSDTTVVMAFEVTEDDLAGAVFAYDDGEHVPALLPLTEEVEPSPYPIHDSVGHPAAPLLPTGCEPAPADVTLVAAEWDVDGGVGVDGQKLARGTSSRALVDHLWLRIELEVTARAGQCGGTFANQETFRVVADGTRIAPVNVLSLTLADGETQPMVYLYSVPDDAVEVALEAGAAGTEVATFDLDVPVLPEPGT